MIASPKTAFDHLVLAASTLEEGEDYIESLTGSRPRRGGKHVAMGTHNSVLRIGRQEYLEVIAIDPDGIIPDRVRWFDLDTPAMRQRLAVSPQLIHWVARTSDIGVSRRGAAVDLGAAYPMERGTLRWNISIPDDGHLPGDGLVPTLIQWSGTERPVDMLEDAGIRVVALAGAHPDPGGIRAALRSLGLAGVMPVTFSDTPRVAAMLQTRRGAVTL